MSQGVEKTWETGWCDRCLAPRRADCSRMRLIPAFDRSAEYAYGCGGQARAVESPWVSTTDRLPDVDQPVVIWNASDETYSASALTADHTWFQRAADPLPINVVTRFMLIPV